MSEMENMGIIPAFVSKTERCTNSMMKWSINIIKGATIP